MVEISVLMTAYNAETYLEEAVRSCLDQEGVDFELIVVDDKSTDATLDILNRLSSEDARMKVISLNENVGQTQALNVGLASCAGTFVARLDADDICLSDRLRRQRDYMRDNPSTRLLGSGAIRITPDGRQIGSWPSVPVDHKEFMHRLDNFLPLFPHSSWFAPLSVFHELDGYRLIDAQDLDFEYRLSRIAGAEIRALPAPLVAIRMHELSNSFGENSLRQLKYGIICTAHHNIASESNEAIDDDLLEKIFNEQLDCAALIKHIRAQRYLVKAYIALKCRRPLRFLKFVCEALLHDPLIVCYLRAIPGMKLKMARAVAEIYTKEKNRFPDSVPGAASTSDI